jgi:hypothetical protein
MEYYIEAQKEEHLQKLEQEKLHREQVGQPHGVPVLYCWSRRMHMEQVGQLNASS